MDVANFRLLTGHDHLRKHLHRFGLTGSPVGSLCPTIFDMYGEHLNYCLGFIDIVAVNIAKNFNHFVNISELYRTACYRLMVDVPRFGVGLKKRKKKFCIHKTQKYS